MIQLSITIDKLTSPVNTSWKMTILRQKLTEVCLIQSLSYRLQVCQAIHIAPEHFFPSLNLF